MNSLVRFSYGHLHMDMPVLANQQRPILHKLCVNIAYNLEDLPGVMDDRERWRQRVKELHAVFAT